MLRFRNLRAQAWLGSWLGTLPAVRALAGPGVATKEAIPVGPKAWAAALRGAVEELAADGVYLDHAGKRKLTGKQLFVGGGAKEAEAAPDDDGVDAVGALNEELFEEDEDLDDLDFDDDDDDES